MLAEIVRAIGERQFAATVAECVLDYAKFELSAVVVHRRASVPVLMFDNFDAVDGRDGLNNYVTATHAVNPMLRCATKPVSVFRARDFGSRVQRFDKNVRPFLVRSRVEEMGFRTLGWPERLEEIGLYFPACGGIVELSLYRERAEHVAEARVLEDLRALGPPIAAAFDTHVRLEKTVSPAAPSFTAALSPREAQVTDLLLLGCDSQAIALRLNISRHTVKDHRKRIFRKLGVGTLAELFALHRQRVL